MSATDLIALITGIAGIITAIGGIFLAIRSVRSKERKAAKEDLDMVNEMLAEERRLRLKAEERNYTLLITLAEHGIKPPERGDDGANQEGFQ